MAERDIKIVDVVFDPTGPEAAGEYVLVRNNGSADVDLTGWRLHDVETHARRPYSYRFPRFTLRGGAEVRVRTGYGVNDADDLWWRRGWAVWNNTGDTAVLENAGGTEIDRFRFGKPRARGGRFPEGFLWGVATAGYQVEGASSGQDWDFFTSSAEIKRRVNDNSHRAGLDINLQPPGDAVQHLDPSVLGRDLDRAAALGVNVYRLSVEWGRLETADTGTAALRDRDIDQQALSYYTTAIDAIRARGMQPMVTLNHLTLPLWVLRPPEATSILGETMEDERFRHSLRGWENAVTVNRFVRFVEYLVPKLKSRVDLWLTLNEPVGSMIGVGYLGGVWPPGFTLDGTRAKAAYFNLIRAHVRAYDAIKRLDDVDADGDGRPARVGLAHAMMLARNAAGSVDGNAWRQFDYFYNWHILDAVIRGEIDRQIAYVPADRDVVSGDAAAAFLGIAAGPWHARLDFVGVNYYRAVAVYWHALVALRANYTGGAFDNDMAKSSVPHGLVNDLGWEMHPAGLSYFLREIHKRHGLPVIVTENGIPESADRNRSAYLVGHLEEVLEAMDGGAAVDGYVHWTLLDNFEWHENYRAQARFGLFTVDRSRAAMPRMLTEGGMTYAQVIAQNSLEGLAAAVGSMAPGGNSVAPPTRLGWISYAALVPPPIGSLVLHVTRLASGRFFALLQYPARERWLRIAEVEWNDTQRRLAFAHPQVGEVPARTFTLTAGPGTLSGEFREGSSAPVHFALDRLALAGPWRVSGMLAWIGFSRVGWDEPWRVRMLTSESGMWQPLPDVTYDAASGTVRSSRPDAGINGTVRGERMDARLDFLGNSLALTLERAPSTLPFG